MAAEKKEVQHRAARRRRRILVGVLVSALVIFGLYSLVMSTVNGIENLFDDTEERKEFETRVSTLVMLDAIPFESLDKADDTVLLQACIWDVLFHEDITKYQTDKHGAYLVPTVDIDRYAARLFGPDFKFNHRTFDLSGSYMKFEYHEDTQTYTMPITSMTNNFTPKVEKIQKEKGQKRVTVGYIAPADVTTNLGAMGQVSDTPVKYYDYIFTYHEKDKDYYLTAIEESETKPEPNAESVPAPAPLEQDELYVPDAGETDSADDKTPLDDSAATLSPEESDTEEPASSEENASDEDKDSDTSSEPESLSDTSDSE